MFIGATQGIGEYTLRELVKAHTNRGHGLCIYVIGRKPEAAEKIFTDCRATHPDAEFHFVQTADLSLLRNVDKASADLTKHLQDNRPDDQEPRIDLLCMSQGGAYFGGRYGASSLSYCFPRTRTDIAGRQKRPKGLILAWPCTTTRAHASHNNS